jgi:protein gp37
MSDLFHESVPNEWIDRIFAVMALCPQHHFQVLTKRPERMLAYFKMVLEEKDMQRWINQVPSLIDGLSGKKGAAEKLGAEIEAWEFPLLNVWLGVSVENQAAADERIPLLLQTPAAMRFLSCEPLLGAVDLSCVPWPADHLHGIDGLNSDGFDALRLDDRNSLAQLAHLDWVIAGGESGPGARPMHPDWARGLRDQCKAASVPFFFKQWGEWLPYGQAPKTMLTTVKPDQSLGWPMYRIGKKVAGSYLNGELHKEFPEVPDANS